MNFRTAIRRRGGSLFDMTPLIDCVFNLLIFFLLTTSVAQRLETVVTIRLPSGSAEAMPARTSG